MFFRIIKNRVCDLRLFHEEPRSIACDANEGVWIIFERSLQPFARVSYWRWQAGRQTKATTVLAYNGNKDAKWKSATLHWKNIFGIFDGAQLCRRFIYQCFFYINCYVVNKHDMKFLKIAGVLVKLFEIVVHFLWARFW